MIGNADSVQKDKRGFSRFNVRHSVWIVFRYFLQQYSTDNLQWISKEKVLRPTNIATPLHCEVKIRMFLKLAILAQIHKYYVMYRRLSCLFVQRSSQRDVFLVRSSAITISITLLTSDSALLFSILSLLIRTTGQIDTYVSLKICIIPVQFTSFFFVNLRPQIYFVS